MSHWLVKSEPYVYSFDDLIRDGKTRWDGVRNYQARNNLRAMRHGDRCLYYHSNEGLEVVGVAEVVGEHYPDPTAESGDWSAVDLGPLARLQHPVPLPTIKSDPALRQIGLVRNPRLSVMPLTEKEFEHIVALGGGLADLTN